MSDVVRKPGRPTKLTQAVQDKICNFIRLGSWMETAAEASGIHKTTLFDWLKRGNDWLEKRDRGEDVPEDEEGYVSFVESVHVAAAESELIDIERIDKAAENVWQAAAWRLERRYPERWARRPDQQVKIENNNTNAVQLNWDQLYLPGEPTSAGLERQIEEAETPKAIKDQGGDDA